MASAQVGVPGTGMPQGMGLSPALTQGMSPGLAQGMVPGAAASPVPGVQQQSMLRPHLSSLTATPHLFYYRLLMCILAQL